MPHLSRSLSEYHVRLQRVSDYIHDHLDEALNLHQLSELACLSPHHWHRIYAAFFGETMAATIKRLRLNRAAGFLAQSLMPIQKVAERSGFPNVQSFTRTFSDAYGLPPAAYRTKGQHTEFQYKMPDYKEGAFEVRIVAVETFDVIGVSHQGSFMEIDKAFGTLYGTLSAHAIKGYDLRCIGIYGSDPFAVAERELRSMACVVPTEEIRQKLTIALPLQNTQIMGCQYAVLRFRGPYASMQAAYRWLFGYWLPKSGLQAADLPLFEDYLNNPRETAPLDLLTDIYLPISQGNLIGQFNLLL
jgi:AraC family transcriptional regulator